MDVSSIATLAMNMAQTEVMEKASAMVLKKALDSMDVNAENMVNGIESTNVVSATHVDVQI